MSRRAFSAPLLFALSVVALCPAPHIRASDPQAIALLQQSLAAVGGTVPSDSQATGSVVLEAGGRIDEGTIRVVTRGLDQSLEEITAPDVRWTVIFSGLNATETKGDSSESLPLELAVTSQSAIFPVVVIAAALSNPDAAFEYLGVESLQGVPAHHLRLWSTFNSNPTLRHLAELTVKEIWIDSASGLPLKLAYERREALGAADRIRVEVFYSDYRDVGGVLYPFRVQKSLQGTPWASISIQSVAFNTGLTIVDLPNQ